MKAECRIASAASAWFNAWSREAVDAKFSFPSRFLAVVLQMKEAARRLSGLKTKKCWRNSDLCAMCC
ncbi:hypothetical protein PSP6_10150 [Paraburkholderia tropica]|nr:hypothetical protein PSP6_10150 [Paraburkholderia tropica]